MYKHQDRFPKNMVACVMIQVGFFRGLGAIGWPHFEVNETDVIMKMVYCIMD